MAWIVFKFLSLQDDKFCDASHTRKIPGVCLTRNPVEQRNKNVFTNESEKRKNKMASLASPDVGNIYIFLTHSHWNTEEKYFGSPSFFLLVEMTCSKNWRHGQVKKRKDLYCLTKDVHAHVMTHPQTHKVHIKQRIILFYFSKCRWFIFYLSNKTSPLNKKNVKRRNNNNVPIRCQEEMWAKELGHFQGFFTKKIHLVSKNCLIFILRKGKHFSRALRNMRWQFKLIWFASTLIDS